MSGIPTGRKKTDWVAADEARLEAAAIID